MLRGRSVALLLITLVVAFLGSCEDFFILMKKTHPE